MGARGKRAAIESLAQRKAPTILIDDNHEVIEECKPEFSTVHLKLRRKPAARRAGAVKGFLEDCGDIIQEDFLKYICQ